MNRLTDLELVEVYVKAKQLNCAEEFILLLREELAKREIEQTMYTVLQNAT